jgi:hypothetical protein
MRFSAIAGAFGFACAVATGFLMTYQHQSIASRLAQAFTLIYFVWYFRKGMYMSGWVGRTYGELQAELSRLDAIAPVDSEVSPSTVEHAASRWKLMQKMQKHPDHR